MEASHLAALSSSPASEPADAFTRRHLGGPVNDSRMLNLLGYSSVDALLDDAVPPGIREASELDLPPPLGEAGVLAALRGFAAANTVNRAMIGAGYYPTITPAVIRRNVLEDPGWYTAYTPYQPEISQGRLEALLNFQTMVADLTGLPTANASLLDEPTAVAEAAALMRRAVGRATKSNVLLVDDRLSAASLAVLETRMPPLGVKVRLVDVDTGLPDCEFFGLVLAQLGDTGGLVDCRPAIAAAHTAGALVAVTADLLALTLIRPPGEDGADVVVGSAQRFGVPLFYGGPHAGFMAVREGLERQLPGRLVGVSVDARGEVAYRMALQTREQHIRRERATSNICTAQVLLAVVSGLYAVYHGPDGLRNIADRVHSHAVTLAHGFADAGYPVVHDRFFDTVLVETGTKTDGIVTAAHERGMLLRRVDDRHVAVACSEITTSTDIETVLDCLPGHAKAGHTATGSASVWGVPGSLQRTSEFLSHPVFHSHHTETQMLRYVRRLSRRDFALDRGMIPLGSCTMKLNAAAELEPISWPEFADIHPHAPAADTAGYAELIGSLEAMLAEITGFDAVSLQPNAGSQGELAGLLAIRGYHRSRGEDRRDVCLIPSSAHGTNAASAVMAGMRVVVVATRDDGTVDLDDLVVKCGEHADRLAAMMLTYPSTAGVYETGITELCRTVHAHGGQVYIDGANMNALLGIAKPGRFGGDVCHLNLHKTFCIPHGGGGPGVGPVAASSHLAPFLPGHWQHPDSSRRRRGAVAGAPFGSAGILPISWAFIRMMGSAGLRQAAARAVLAANYVARRLNHVFPVLYTGASGLVAHECILDVRPLTNRTGVTVDDIAKRLIDYGFHAPTMSFPVPGTFMVEPTESEDLAELDRFCDAMVAIGSEINEIATGCCDVADSPLRRAPHTIADLAEAWAWPYSPTLGAFPGGGGPDKYWPPVGRIDQAHGDRNLFCSCPPVATYDDDTEVRHA